MFDILYLGIVVAAYVIFSYFVKWCQKQVEDINN